MRSVASARTPTIGWRAISSSVSLVDSPLCAGGVRLIGQSTGAFHAVKLVGTLFGAAGARARRGIVGAKRAGALREGDQAAVRAEEVQLCERRAARQPGFYSQRRRGHGAGLSGDAPQGEHGPDPEGDGPRDG